MNFDGGRYPEPWLHQFEGGPLMPWTVLENDPAQPYMIMESAGFTKFRMFRPHHPIMVGDTIE
jgi:hypothetical protein